MGSNASTKKKLTAVNVMLMKQQRKSVPKNTLRRRLLADGRIKTVHLSRDEDSNSVDTKIREAFGIADSHYKILECDGKSQRLSLSPLRDIDGHQAIERRRLYLCEVSN